MNRYPSPERWADQLTRATLTLVVAAIGLRLAWHLLSTIFVPLLIVGALLLILRLAVGAVAGRDRW